MCSMNNRGDGQELGKSARLMLLMHHILCQRTHAQYGRAFHKHIPDT